MRDKDDNDNTAEQLKAICKATATQRRKAKIQKVCDETEPNLLRTVKQAQDRGASSWLNALPIKEQNFCLNKEEFSDALRLRYNFDLTNIPSSCPCGERFSIEHALSCKKGGLLHNVMTDFET